MKYKIVAHIKIAPCRLVDSEINSERRLFLGFLGLSLPPICDTLIKIHALPFGEDTTKWVDE